MHTSKKERAQQKRNKVTYGFAFDALVRRSSILWVFGVGKHDTAALRTILALCCCGKRYLCFPTNKQNQMKITKTKRWRNKKETKTHHDQHNKNIKRNRRKNKEGGKKKKMMMDEKKSKTKAAEFWIWNITHTPSRMGRHLALSSKMCFSWQTRHVTVSVSAFCALILQTVHPCCFNALHCFDSSNTKLVWMCVCVMNFEDWVVCCCCCRRCGKNKKIGKRPWGCGGFVLFGFEMKKEKRNGTHTQRERENKNQTTRNNKKKF